MPRTWWVDRLERLPDERRYDRLAQTVADDFAQISPGSTLRRHGTYLADPWDFDGVYSTLHDFLRGYAFKPDDEDYYIHITTGSHVAQICWFLLAESRHFPGRLRQTYAPLSRTLSSLLQNSARP